MKEIHSGERPMRSRQLCGGIRVGRSARKSGLKIQRLLWERTSPNGFHHLACHMLSEESYSEDPGRLRYRFSMPASCAHGAYADYHPSRDRDILSDQNMRLSPGV